MKKKIYLGVMGVLLCCALAHNAFAQLFVEEGKIKDSVTPGQTIVGNLTLDNTSNSPIGVVAYLEDFKYVPPFDGTKKFLPAGTADDSASAWISFQPKELTLPPKSKRKIRYAISVPKNVTGGHYSVLFFERKDRKILTHGQVGLQIIARVGSLFFLETKDSIKKASVTDLSYHKHTISGKLHNDGNINLVATCVYYIMNGKGVPVDRGQLRTFYMAEGAAVDFSFKVDQSLPPGSYKAIMTFDLQDGVSSVKEFEFSI